ncbi:MAG: flagellar hook capping FlgD N-terminal domain-containing protein [Eubacteriales bacterium]
MNSVNNIKQGLLNTYNDRPSKSEQDEMGKDTFLELLTTQMRYQDPLDPTDDKEFLAQMAQFTSLEQMQNLNHNFTLQQGFTLIGKEVVAKVIDPNTTEENWIEGKVESVNINAGEMYLEVNDKTISLEDIEKVKEPNEIEEIENFVSDDEVNA